MAEHSHRTFNTKWSITDDGIRYEGKFIPFSEIRRVVIHESDDSVGYFTSFDVNDYVLYYNSLRRYDKIEAKADAETIERKVNECLEKIRIGSMNSTSMRLPFEPKKISS